MQPFFFFFYFLDDAMKLIFFYPNRLNEMLIEHNDHFEGCGLLCCSLLRAVDDILTLSLFTTINIRNIPVVVILCLSGCFHAVDFSIPKYKYAECFFLPHTGLVGAFTCSPHNKCI